MPGISCGVIGLPNVGKSTLFNALTRAGAKVENYPFCTIDPNVGVVNVPDERLARLNAVEQRPDQIPAVVEFVDIAGLVEGASRGEGRGNEFLEQVQHAHLLVHVVRCFSDPNVAHVRAGAVDPIADMRIINIELILADLQMAQRALERARKRARAGEREARDAVVALETVAAHLDAEQPARSAPLAPEQWGAMQDCRFLTRKPVMYVANVGEDALPAMDAPAVAAMRAFAAAEDNTVLPVCARLEAEIAELDADDAAAFLDELGLRRSGLDRLISECYRQLGLITFFTVGEHEVRAWTVRRGATAPEAGGVIHSDFHDAFIRAEVIAFADFAACGSRQAAREQGKMRVEGKDYVVQDGDIIFFRVGR